MRLLTLIALLVALALLPAASAGVKSACALVTAADAAKALGGPTGRGKHQILGLYDSCTYTAKSKTLTVQTRQLSRSDFERSAKANPGPVVRVSGLGSDAFSVAGGVSLLVWKNGTAVTLLLLGINPALPVEKQLAKIAVSRI
jgi:hypothetical protein